MRKNAVSLRQITLFSIGLSYLLPMGFFCILAAKNMVLSERLPFVLTAIALSSLGFSALFLTLRVWEKGVHATKPKQQALPPPTLSSPITAAEGLYALEATKRHSWLEEQSIGGFLDILERVKTFPRGTFFLEVMPEPPPETGDRDSLEWEKRQLLQEIESLRRERLAERQNSQEKLDEKSIFLEEYQKTIREQREVIQRKQQMVSDLEAEVKDLRYEIKTLVEVNQYVEPLPPVTLIEPIPKEAEFPIPRQYSIPVQHTLQSPLPSVPFSVKNDIRLSKGQDASLELKRCIDIAQKITGGSHFASPTSRFQELSADNHALELRRLFDNFRGESSFPILLYSLKENKLLFVNNEIKDLLGFGPDKFIYDFPHILRDGMADWRMALSRAAEKQETKVQLFFRTKSGEDRAVFCHLSAIPTGIFRSHVVGILYPVS